MSRAAFLGTGMIGAAMAEAAARRGEAVVAWNRTLAKARPLADAGAEVVADVRDAVRGAARVHLVLTDDAAVDAVLDACGDALAPEAIVIDHTTASPRGTLQRAARLEARGVAWLHAPVFMSPASCRDARGVMLASGARATFERARPGLAAMTGKLEYLGERRDLAAAYKLFGNAAILALVGTFADVLAIGAELGVEPAQAHALFEIFDPGVVLKYRGASMARGDYAPSFDLATARKDVRLMLEAAGPVRALSVLPGLAARMDALLARGHAADDVGVMAVDTVPPAEPPA